MPARANDIRYNEQLAFMTDHLPSQLPTNTSRAPIFRLITFYRCMKSMESLDQNEEKTEHDSVIK
jgi:hypothetical protein